MPIDNPFKNKTRAEHLTDAVIAVLSQTLSAGQLSSLRPDIESSLKASSADFDAMLRDMLKRLTTLLPRAEYHEDDGCVIWWQLPVDSPPYCGTPSDSDWSEYYTHWSSLMDIRLMKASDGATVIKGPPSNEYPALPEEPSGESGEQRK